MVSLAEESVGLGDGDGREGSEEHLDPLDVLEGRSELVFRAGEVSRSYRDGQRVTHLLRLLTLPPSRKSVVTSSVMR